MSYVPFKVFLNSPNFVPPNTGSYYLVAKDGIYFRQECALGSAFVKVKEIPHLVTAPKDYQINIPKVDGLTIAKAFAFFRQVFHTHRSESYLTLIFNKDLQKFDLWCPKQTVSYSSVNYDRSDISREPGWVPIGTIHSHCDFSAFHSGTDTSDEASFDGIHITLGHVNRNEFSMVSSVVFSDNRRQSDPLDLVDGVIASSQHDVQEKGYVAGTTWMRRENYFKLNLTQEEQDELAKFDDNILPIWMQNVNKYSYPATGYRIKSDKYEDYEYYKHRDGKRHKYNPLDDTNQLSFGWTDSDIKDNVPDSEIELSMNDDDRFHEHEYNRGEDVSIGYNVSLETSIFSEYIEGYPKDFPKIVENLRDDLPNKDCGETEVGGN